jgi:hypothetical protein
LIDLRPCRRIAVSTRVGLRWEEFPIPERIKEPLFVVIEMASAETSSKIPEDFFLENSNSSAKWNMISNLVMASLAIFNSLVLSDRRA